MDHTRTIPTVKDPYAATMGERYGLTPDEQHRIAVRRAAARRQRYLTNLIHGQADERTPAEIQADRRAELARNWQDAA